MFCLTLLPLTQICGTTKRLYVYIRLELPAPLGLKGNGSPRGYSKKKTIYRKNRSKIRKPHFFTFNYSKQTIAPFLLPLVDLSVVCNYEAQVSGLLAAWNVAKAMYILY